MIDAKKLLHNPLLLRITEYDKAVMVCCCNFAKYSIISI